MSAARFMSNSLTPMGWNRRNHILHHRRDHNVETDDRNSIRFDSTYVMLKIPYIFVHRLIVEEHTSIIFALEEAAPAVEASCTLVEQHLQKNGNSE